MNDDLEERLRRTLRARAADVTAAPDAWARLADHTVIPIRSAPDRRLLVAIPAAVIGLAAALVVGVMVSRPTAHARQLAASQPQRSSASSSAGPAAPAFADRSASGVAAPGPSGAAGAGGSAGAIASSPLAAPAGGPVPPGFAPASVTFVSPDHGWVLGTAPCATPPCTSILRTRDGGSSWAGIAAPRAPLASGASGGVAHLRFADEQNGWAYGGTPTASTLYATHDGGSTWNAVTLPVVGQLSDLETAAGLAHAVVLGTDGSVRILTTPTRTDAWTPAAVTIPVGAGPVPHAQLVLQGRSGWVVEVDRTVVGGARLVNGTWTHWTPPCADVQGPAILAASSPTELVAACQVGLWSEPRGEHLYISRDGGSSFTESAGPADPTNGAVAIASPSPSAVVLGVSSLVASFDAGGSWTTVYAGDPKLRIIELGFTNPSLGVAVAGNANQPSVLLRSGDGGRSWAPVRFP